MPWVVVEGYRFVDEAVLIQVPFIPFSYLIGCRGCNSRVPDPVIGREAAMLLKPNLACHHTGADTSRDNIFDEHEFITMRSAFVAANVQH